MKTSEAISNLGAAFYKNYDSGLGGVPEACNDVNDASRAVMAAFLDEHTTSESDEVWTVKLNVYDVDARSLNPFRRGMVLRNFEADFIIPEYDAYLHGLCQKWNRNEGGDGWKEYGSTLWSEIERRVKELGGVGPLVWS